MGLPYHRAGRLTPAKRLYIVGRFGNRPLIRPDTFADIEPDPFQNFVLLRGFLEIFKDQRVGRLVVLCKVDDAR